eukprot:11213204-Lingulodinium_polyedra.AAC.1
MQASLHVYRQGPLTSWTRCRAACAPNLRFPGQRAARRRAVAIGELPWSIGARAIAALDAL